MSSSDWRNVRIKEEPVSDYEGSRASSSSSRNYDRDRRDHRRRTPSPPPSHSKHRKAPRSRSRSPPPPPSRDDRERSRRRDRSRSRERYREVPPPVKQERDRSRGESSRDREGEFRERFDSRRIKREPRSRSRSPSDRRRDLLPPPPPRDDRRDRSSRPDNRNNERDSRPPRNEKRERDWDNFFNPNSEMSKQAYVKREKEEKERKMGVQEFGKKDDESEKPQEKEQPNFGLSGKLTEETNTYRGVVIKYSEPPEARKPNKIRWRFYPFKGEEALPVMYVHRQSAYLIGRDRKVADIPVDHPSCSKQHAALQYRLVPYQRPDGSKGRRIRPYIIDLESANGTFVNGKQIEAKRYVELFEKDVLKFGFSSREYVLLHDESKDIEDDYQELTPD